MRKGKAVPNHSEPIAMTKKKICKTYNLAIYCEWFQGKQTIKDEHRVKFVCLAQHMKAHPDFKHKCSENPDSINRDIAFAQIFTDVMAKQRKNELDLYRLIAKDDAFWVAMQDTLKRILGAGR